METSEPDPNRVRPHVVVVGGGFGGVAAVRHLRNTDVEVTLVDRHAYSTFKPLLYQVATANLNAGDITWFQRAEGARNRRFRFVLGDVVDLDVASRRIGLEGGRVLGYDHLVIATGVSAEWYGVPGAREHALPLYGRAEALALRDRLFAGLESVAAEGARRDVRVVVVGGGATGVETVGALAEMRNRDLLATYPELDPARVHLTLVERGPDLLAPFHPRLRAYAARALQRRGVDLRLDTAVAEVRADGVRLDRAGDSQWLDADLVVWASGVRVPDVVRSWGLPMLPGGRVAVDDHCRVVGLDRVYAIGDIAARDGAALPQVAPPALQQGAYVARLLDRTTRGRRPRPFRYRDKGTMAVIGRGSAVAEIAFLPRLTGLPAWLAWVGLHLVMLLDRRNRAATLANLVTRYVVGTRNVIVGDRVGGVGDAAPAAASWAGELEPTDR